MPVKISDNKKIWQRHTPIHSLLSWLGWLLGILLVIYCWRLISEQTMWVFVHDAPRQAGDLFSRMVPPLFENGTSTVVLCRRTGAPALGYSEHRHTRNPPGNSASDARFGYWKITVERPLRLKTHVTPERVQTFKASNPKLAKLADIAQEVLGDAEHLDWNGVEETLQAAFKKQGVKATAANLKKLRDAISEIDEAAEPVIAKRHKDGSVEYEPDSSLRDTENVPLKDTIQGYFEREVLPHVPDAWIDHGKTGKGYEISFTKYFYKYQPLRSLEEIKADILRLEAETDGVLREIVEV